MKLIFISDNGNHHTKLKLNVWLHIILPISVLIVASLVVGMNYKSSIDSRNDKVAFGDFSSILNKLSTLDAEVQRLNELSTFLASKTQRDIKDFSLSNKPAMGGSNEINQYFGSTIIRKKNLLNNVKEIEKNLRKQRLKLSSLAASLEIKEAQAKLDKLSNKLSKNNSTSHGVHYDFSTPLKKGYISSLFGNRRDPINGNQRHHNGLDIAANKGSKIYAIANGFVTFKGKKGAYGNLLEINHSESLKSRYAHLDSFSVKKGQLVRKGDLIGTVGETGRVTGPHLHLEIKENNKIIDPNIYLKSALKRL